MSWEDQYGGGDEDFNDCVRMRYLDKRLLAYQAPPASAITAAAASAPRAT